MTSPSFNTLGLPEPLARACEVLDYTRPTPVQASAIPPALAGRDVLAQAPTGSGKTVAFGLPLLARVQPASQRVQALVLCPTRELADQVAKDLRALARFLPNLKLLTLCGGIPLRPQLASLEIPPDVVVGTPGRVLELVETDALSLSSLQTFVLDEADRMLDMGFIEPITTLARQMPRQRQTLLFSATFADAVRGIAGKLLRQPEEVAVEGESKPAIGQRIHRIRADQRHWAVAQVLADENPDAALVFCNTRAETAALCTALQRDGFAADALHGDLEQRDREEVLVRFGNGSLRVLVATDVAARGLDIAGLPLVISAELASDADQHTHRIGRTGRAGQTGLAIALVTDADAPRQRAIEQAQGGVWLDEKPLALSPKRSRPAQAPYRTLQIDGGRQDKLRPGDLLGALTGSGGLPGSAIGKIDLFATRCYVAIAHPQAQRALEALRSGTIKAKRWRVRLLA